MKFFQKRAVAAAVLVLAIAFSCWWGLSHRPDESAQASTTIVGSYTYTTEMEEVTELLNEGKMVIAPAVGKPWPLEEGPVVFQKIIRGEMKEAKVILRP